jgi:6-pyruvoyltetrahydropterin/6-carboxytetrahydropterin synthase
MYRIFEGMKIFKQFTFDAAHFLPNVPEGHKCREIHGHTYQLKIILEGESAPGLDWVMDFGDLKKIVNPVIDEVDHKFLNQVKGLENPTCEAIAIWIWNKIRPQLPLLKSIELNETPTSGVIYEGE